MSNKAGKRCPVCKGWITTEATVRVLAEPALKGEDVVYCCPGALADGPCGGAVLGGGEWEKVK